MYLYLLTQNKYTTCNHYRQIVVCAENDQEAKEIVPLEPQNTEDDECDWVKSYDEITVKMLGIASKDIPKGIITAYYVHTS